MFFRKKYSTVKPKNMYLRECCITLLEGGVCVPILRRNDLKYIALPIKGRKHKYPNQESVVYGATVEIYSIFNHLKLPIKKYDNGTLSVNDAQYLRLLVIQKIINS